MTFRKAGIGRRWRGHVVMRGGLVLENRLEPLIDDTGAMHMANLTRLNGEAHLYVVHVVSEPEVIHMLEYITNDEGQVEGHGEVQKELHGGEEDGDGVEVKGEGDGDVQEVHEGEEDGHGVEVEGDGDDDVEQELHVCEGVVEEEVDLHVNVEVEVESLSESSDNNFDDDDRGLSDEEWKYEELLSATDNDE
ncbi:major centromere autoantigen B-like [Vigna radiata var. radiata]|uniref:Major centromere autoantigen B-like n=1 Tax=Vigna radiata var. radiata TaxID=3916 RepID=A0A1S3T9E8_VIGRR|nr:major centromere autoantigen B-like [Vigna radiata var. radiata]